MNIFDLGKMYIDAILECNQNLEYDAIVNMIALLTDE